MSEHPTSNELIEQIRRAHASACPKPTENPAWTNCHVDCGILLAELDRQRAEVERLTREAAEWQPIETAPRGPACLFLIVPKSEEETWADTSGRPITAHGEPYIVMGPYGQWGSLWKATHWMPLPRAPAGTPHCPTCVCSE